MGASSAVPQADPAKNLRDREDEEELAELPPLDGGDEDPEVAEEDEELDDDPSALGDPFDDATGEDDPLEELQATEEGSWLEDGEAPEAAETLEFAEIIALAESDSLTSDTEELGAEEEDFGLTEDEATAVDAGEEGPTDADEELREADLPALDADADGVGDDSKFYEMALGEEDGAPPFPWDPSPWVAVGAPLDVGPMACIACAARGAIAASSGRLDGERALLRRVDLEGIVTPLEGRGVPSEAPLRLAFVAGVVWLETEGGTYASTDGGASFSRESGWPEGARPPRGLAETWSEGGTVTALAGDATLTALYSSDENRTWLVRGAATGERRIVTVIEATAKTGRAASMEVKDLAWDETRGVVWAAGDFGVLAFQPAPALRREDRGG